MNNNFISDLVKLVDLAAVKRRLRDYYGDLVYLDALTDWAFSDDLTRFSHYDLSEVDILYIKAISEHKAFRTSRTAQTNVIDIGSNYDPIGYKDCVDAWPASKVLCFLIAQKTSPEKKCAMVVGMRDEGITSLEWIAHYKAIGAERIFIYTNDNRDQSERILEILAEHDEIVLIRNGMGTEVYPQLKIYEHFLLMLPEARDFEWCGFFDSDELFAPAAKFEFSIIGLLEEVELHAPACSAIWYPWRWAVSDRCFAREPGLLPIRFKNCSKHTLVKSLARVKDILNMKPLHSPYILEGCFAIDGALQPRAMDELFVEHDWPEDTGILYHYWCKSFEEFYLKKSRGDTIKLEDNAYRRDLSQFFDWNGNADSTPLCVMSPHLLDKVTAVLDRLSLLPDMRGAIASTENSFRRLVAQDDAGRPLRLLYQELSVAGDKKVRCGNKGHLSALFDYCADTHI